MRFSLLKAFLCCAAAATAVLASQPTHSAVLSVSASQQVSQTCRPGRVGALGCLTRQAPANKLDNSTSLTPPNTPSTRTQPPSAPRNTELQRAGQKKGVTDQRLEILSRNEGRTLRAPSGGGHNPSVAGQSSPPGMSRQDRDALARGLGQLPPGSTRDRFGAAVYKADMDASSATAAQRRALSDAKWLKSQRELKKWQESKRLLNKQQLLKRQTELKKLAERKRLADLSAKKNQPIPKKWKEPIHDPQTPSIPQNYEVRQADGLGLVYQKPGANFDTHSYRLMLPNSLYKNGYWVKTTNTNQAINISTNKPGFHNNETHIPLPDGFWDVEFEEG